MKDTLTTALLLTGLLGLLGFVGPALDVEDHGYEHEVAREELAKQRQQERFSKAASSMCGNGYAVDVEGAVVCRVRKALKAGRASL